MIQTGKEVKPSSFANPVILYIENPKEYTHPSPTPPTHTIRTNKWVQQVAKYKFNKKKINCILVH